MTVALLHDVAALADVQRRAATARAIAHRLGADDLIVFIDDDELGVALPALGFPKTMPDGRAWHAFLADAREEARAHVSTSTSTSTSTSMDTQAAPLARELPCPFTQERKTARAFVRPEAVLVLVGGIERGDARTDDLAHVLAAVPLLAALFRSERTTAAGRAHAAVARQSAQRAEALAAHLAASQADLHRTLRALHESREWFSTTLRSIGDAVITTDARACVTFMNPIAEALTGWASEDAQGRPLVEIFHILDESSRDVVTNPIEVALRDGLIVGLANHTVLLRRDGSEVAVDDSAAPIRDPGGAITGAVLIFRDVTSRRGVERARSELVDELQRVVSGNELFAAILGHDLRNPLGAITMSAELLARTSNEPRTQTVVERILRSGRRMRRMIDQLLDFTRARHGAGLVLACKDGVDVHELTEHVISELAVAHPDWQIAIKRHGDVRAGCDPDRIAQVMSNLVGNAIKHGMPSGGVQVRVDGNDLDDVIVEVRNQGSIPADVLPTVFDPFRSGRSQRDQQTDGLGLGLFITKEIVRAHGGDVEVASTPATGTTFRLRLPRRLPRPALAR